MRQLAIPTMSEDRDFSALPLERTDELPPIRTLAGKYRLGRLLGEGGMGSVYEAEHLGLGTSVALKLLSERFAADPVSLTRFRREARLAAAVRHPNVIAVTDTGTDEFGVPFLVMELLDGESLASWIRRYGSISPTLAVAVTQEILAGISAAHDKGIVHRDLKPANIFLARQKDGSYCVKVLDFGISKLAVDNFDPEVTADGAVVGTPLFMAPEQASRLPNLDARVDVYSVGAMLYRMVAGRMPYPAAPFESSFAQLAKGHPLPPRSVRPEISNELQQVMLRAVDVDRDRRFRDAHEFREALDRAWPSASALHPIRLGGEDESSGDSREFYVPQISSHTPPSLTPRESAGPQAAPKPTREERQRKLALAIAVLLPAFILGMWGWRAMHPRQVDANRAHRRAAEMAGSGLVAHARKAVRIGVTAYMPKTLVQEQKKSLFDYLEQHLGRSVEMVVVDNYVDLADKLFAGEVDVAALSPYAYVKAKRRDPTLSVIATPVTRIGATHEGYVLSRVSSNIRRLQDLRDRVFCYVSPTSTSGYLYPRALFIREGMDPDSFFKATRFTGDHLAALSALKSEACDGAVVYANILFEARDHGLEPESFRILATTDRIPNDAYCLLDKGSNRAVLPALRAAFLSLEPGGDAARRVFSHGGQMIGFTQASDADYETVRNVEKILESHD